MDAPRNTLRIARRVRRRTLLAASVRRAGVGLLAGSALGLAALVAQRAGLWRPDLRWGLGWWVIACAPALGGLVVGAASGLLGRRSLMAAAQAADRAMGLRDRLSNALAFGAGPAGPAEVLAIRDAERMAERVSPARVVPLRWGSSWAVWPAVLAAAVGTGLWAPQRERAASVAVSHEASEPEIRAAAEVIASAAEEVRRQGPLNDRAAQEELDRVAELERELLDGEREPADALAEGARRLDSLADRVEREAGAEALVDQATRERLADGLDASDGDSDLARALAEGDLQGARDAAAELMDRYERLTPEQRERYAGELDRLAEQLREARAEDAGWEQDRAADDAGASALEEALRSQGIDEPAALPETADPSALREELERRGVEPDIAEDLAERLARENQESQAAERAEQELERLAESARDAADELREPPRPEGQEPGREARENTAQERPQGEQQTERERGAGGEEQRREGQGEERQGQEGQAQERQGPEGQGQEGQAQERQGQEGQGQEREGQGEQKQEGERDGQRQERQEGREGQGGREQGGQPRDQGREQQGEGKEAREGQGDQRQGVGERRGEQGQEQGQSQGQEQGQEQGQSQGQEQGQRQGREGQRQGQREGQAEGQQQDGARGEGQTENPGVQGEREVGRESPGGGEEPDGPARMTDGQGEAPDARGVERLRRQLDRMAERGGSAEQGRRSARELREQAERMLEQASPEERRELERLAREMSQQAGEGPRPGAGPDRSERLSDAGARPAPQREWGEEAFDARGADDGRAPRDGQVVADWYGDDGARPRTEPGGAGSAPALREATRSAERALERRAVPRERQDLVRRVFERFRERAGENREGAGQDGAGSGGSGTGSADD